MKHNDTMQSLISKAKYLGSAKSGLHHWISQRLSALALIPLIIWFLFQIPFLSVASQKQSIVWLSSPFNMSALLILISAVLYHGALGMQVVMEDYIGHKGVRFISIVCLQFVALCLWMISIVMTLMLTLGIPHWDGSAY